MSRSNPTANTPNPATRWFRWRGGDGVIEYWDKEKKEAVIVKLPFTFILLDRLNTVRGYNEKLETGIYANEVRDVRSDPLTVKLFKGNQVIANGLWSDIKDRVVANDGKFGVNLYIGYKDGAKMKLGAIECAGCAVSPWFDFEKQHRKALFEQAVTMARGAQAKTGSVKFYPPVYSLKEISAETNAAALELDKELQAYLADYFKRPTAEKIVARDEAVQRDPADAPQPDAPYDEEPPVSDQEAEAAAAVSVEDEPPF